MSVFFSLLQVFSGKGTLRKFRKQCENPMKAQSDLLEYILRKNKNTLYGKMHCFGKVRGFDDYQTQIPISTYDMLRNLIEAEMEGKPGQLTVDPPVFYATTSGTTGPIKYIPITMESRRSRAHLLRIRHFFVNSDHPKMYSHKVLSVVSPEVETLAPSGIPCGAESGRSYRTMPRILSRQYAVPYETFELHDFDAKYYCLARIAAGEKISFIFTCNPSTILLICKTLDIHGEEIIRDIRNGTLSDRYDYPDAFQNSLQKRLRPDPSRARFIEDAAAQGGGRLLPKYLWPELEVLSCWTGGTVGVYIKKFQEYFSPHTVLRDIGYVSSEFFGTIPISDGIPDGVLAISHNVYEFHPMSNDSDPDAAKLLKVGDLKLGERYRVYVTTLGGLYRYDMGDIIEVCGFYEKTPLIKFIQKCKGVTSFVGEKLSETQAIEAIGKALHSIKGGYEFIAAVGEIRDELPQYSFLVEFDHSKPTRQECENIVRNIDANLIELNTEYSSKRKSLRLGHASLRIVKSGEFDRYRNRMVSKGKSDGAFKTLRLIDDSSFIDEFVIEDEILQEETGVYSISDW